MIVAIILSVVLLIFALICTFKESDIIGLYKSTGLFGRAKAFFTFDFTVAGFGSIVAGIVFAIMNAVSGKAPVSAYDAKIMIISGVIILPIGLLLLMSIMKRCDPKARPKVLMDLTVVALGLMFKFSFFFLNSMFALWAYDPAEVYTLEDGRQVYIYGTSVYDLSMRLIGRYNSSTDTVTLL